MGTISTYMFQRGLAINVNMDISSYYLINAKPMGTISAHMFQLMLRLNVCKNIDASTKKLRIKTFATCLGLKDNVKKNSHI